MPSACIRTRLKFLAHVDMGQSPPSAEYSDSAGDGLPFLQGTADFGHVFPEPKTFCSSPNKVAISGDILFSVRAPVGELNIAKQDIGIGRGLCAIRAESSLNDRFAWWALHEAREQLNYVSTGSTYEAVSIEDVANTFLCDVPIDKQRLIADYLDLETVRMDTLLAAKERLLEILAEKRRALITHAVTRGLNPNAPLRDSGIPWLGQIPKYWEVKKLKHTTTINDETLSEITLPTYEFFYVDIGNVEYLKGICSKELFVFENAPSRARRIVRDGDTIVSTVRTYLRAIAPIRKAEDNLIVSTGFAVVRPRSIDSTFLSYALQSTYFVETIVSRSTGVSYPAINASEIGTIPLCLPPIHEQSEIAAHIQKETSKIDALRTAAERTIGLLKERRAALISEAVTGKIKPIKSIAESS